jgi:WD40 repeat protein
MELVDGADLEELVERCGPLSAADACELVRQAAAGLDHARQSGLVHRDVKPSNLLLSREGVLKVLDLGLALLEAPEAADRGLTSRGVVMGTADYMAPEQASNPHAVDTRADVYSLGCTLYCLLGGRPPFGGPEYDTALKKILAHTREPVPPIGELRSGLPVGLVSTLERALAKEPAARYSTPANLAAAVTPFAAGSDLKALLGRAEAARGFEVVDGSFSASTEGISAMAELCRGPAEAPSRVEVAPREASAGRRWTWSRIAAAAAAAFLLVLGGGIGVRRLIRVEHEDGRVTELAVDGVKSIEIRDGEGKRLAVVGTAESQRAGRDTAPEVEHGAPLSALALVSAPAPLAGVRRWTVETRGHRGAGGGGSYFGGFSILDVRYRPDGGRVATAGVDGTVRLWASAKGDLEKVLVGHDGPVLAVAWSPDGAQIASASDDQTVRRWDAASGKLLGVPARHPYGVVGVDWSPDGARLASLSRRGTLMLWDAGSPEAPKVLRDLPHTSISLDWSPEGPLGNDVIAVAYTGGIVLVDARSGAELGRFDEKELPLALAFSLDGSKLAYHVTKEGLRVRDVATGVVKTLPTGAAAYARSLAWSPDGQLLAAEVDGKIELWDPAARRQVAPPSVDQRFLKLAWSPDGAVLAAGVGPTLEFLDPRSGHVLRRGVEGQDIEVADVAWSPDSRRLVSTGTARSLVVWDTTTGAAIKASERTDAAGWSRAAWSPDGARFAIGYGDGVIVRDGASGEVVEGKPGQMGSSAIPVSWHPDSRLLACVAGDRKTVLVWEPGSGSPPKPVGELRGAVLELAWSPDGKFLAAAGCELEVWKIASGESVKCVWEAPDANALAWSPDGRAVAAAYGEGVNSFARLFDAASGKELAVLKGHEGAIRSLAWTSGGQEVVSSDADRTVRRWEASSGRLVATLQGVDAGVFSPDVRFLASPLRNAVKLWDLQGRTPRPLGTLVALSRKRTLALSPDGHFRGSPGAEKEEVVYVVETDSGQETLSPAEFAARYGWKNDPERVRLLGTERVAAARVEAPPPRSAVPEAPTALPAPAPSSTALSGTALVSEPPKLAGADGWTLETRLHRGEEKGIRCISGLSCRPDGRALATAGADGTVRIWDAASGALLRVLLGHDGALTSVAWSPKDPRLLASGSLDRTVRLWDPSSGTLITTLRGHDDGVRCLGFSPDGATLASGSSDFKLELWDVEARQGITKLSGHRNQVAYLAWAPSGETLASASTDGEVLIWAAGSGRELRRIVVVGGGNAFCGLSFSADGSLLALGLSGGAVRFWDAAPWDEKPPLNFPGDIIYSLAWQPGGAKLACAGQDLVLWDSTVKEWLPKLTKEQHYSAVFAPGGSTLFTLDGSSVTTLHSWEMRTNQEARATPAGFPMHPGEVAWSAGGKQLACGSWSRHGLWVWDLESGAALPALGASGYAAVAWSPDGKDCAGGSGEGLRVWTLEARHQAVHVQGPALDALAWSADGSSLACGQPDGSVLLWKRGGVEPPAEVYRHEKGVMDLAWSPAGELLASAGLDGKVHLWAPDRGGLRSLDIGGEALCLAWSPDASRLAVSARVERPEVQLWDPRTGERTDTLSGHAHLARDLAWTDGGRTLLASCSDGSIAVFEAGSGQAPRIAARPGRGFFSPDGRFLAAPAASGVRLWDVAAGCLTSTIVGITGGRWLCVRPDGHYRGSPRIEGELVYVVKTEAGQETLSPDDFAARYGWKNDPERARPLGK